MKKNFYYHSAPNHGSKLANIWMDTIYIITKEEQEEIIFEFKNKSYGVTLRVNSALLAFSSGRNEDGLFEIMQTASVFLDDDIIKQQFQEWIQDDEDGRITV